MPRRLFVRIAIILAAPMLAYYWWRTIAAAEAGVMFVHENYWSAPIGTWALFVVLGVLTPAYVWCVWKFWNWQGHTVEKNKS